MEKNIGFRVTVEFDCTDMIDEKTFHDKFNGDPMKAYRSISDKFRYSPDNYSTDNRVTKVELLDPNENLEKRKYYYICLSIKTGTGVNLVTILQESKTNTYPRPSEVIGMYRDRSKGIVPDSCEILLVSISELDKDSFSIYLDELCRG